jgi:tripartite ATP-independent transporter DctP family solute receptor
MKEINTSFGKLKVLIASCLLLFLFTFSSCLAKNEVKSIKLAHSLDINHSVHKGMEFMAKRVAEKSNGTMRLDLYPNGQLGTERQCLELLQIGSLGMTKVSVAVMENFSPNMQVLGLPYLFRDRQHSYDVLDGPIGKRLLDEAQDYWLKGMTFFDAGYRSFYTKERVDSPEDLKGMKIRVMESVTAMNMVRALGGAPTPISWGEIYTSLQQGVVDGAENNPPSFFLSRHYEVCKFYTLDEHTAVPDILVMSTHAWNRLNKQEQQWLSEAVEEATEVQRKLWQESEISSLEAVAKAGVEVIRPDKTKFAELTKNLLTDYKDNKELYSLIQQIQETK